ncbi:hypothetical protein KKF34_07315 [Myxococcota bacterium]|nr:hypothetical protein [Myxococcota bacterium]MBU1382824.1 hypothetical protein [Myxococcota bacterium]MBU1496668.1 hypothetical protein [Myxococcota bacterium]
MDKITDLISKFDFTTAATEIELALAEDPENQELKLKLALCQKLSGNDAGCAATISQIDEKPLGANSRSVSGRLNSYIKAAAACGVILGLGVTGCSKPADNTNKTSTPDNSAMAATDDAKPAEDKPKLPEMAPDKPVSNSMDKKPETMKSGASTMDSDDDAQPPAMKYGIRRYPDDLKMD